MRRRWSLTKFLFLDGLLDLLGFLILRFLFLGNFGTVQQLVEVITDCLGWYFRYPIFNLAPLGQFWAGLLIAH